MSLEKVRRAMHPQASAAIAAASPLSSDRPLLRIEVDGRTMLLIGELDRSTAPLLQRGASAAQRIDRIDRIDLAGLTFIDVAGVRALMAVRHREPGISIVGASRATRRVIELVGALDLLHPTPDAGSRDRVSPPIHRAQPPAGVERPPADPMPRHHRDEGGAMHTVEELMSTPVRTVRPDDDVGTVRDLMRSEHIHAAPVVDDADRLVGIVTSADLVDALEPQQCVQTVMSTDVVTCSPNTPVTDAAGSMLAHRVHHLVVTQRDEVVGILSSFDALGHLAGRVRRPVAAASPGTRAADSSKGLHAEPGDVIVVRARRLGERERRATVIEAGEGGTAPFTVRWSDDPHDEPHLTIYFPGSDAYVEHHAHT